MTVKDPSLKLSAKDEVSQAHKVKQIYFKLNKLTCFIVTRRGGRGSVPVKKVNIILNKQLNK